MNTLDIEKVIIYTRGKNRDECGNPYRAFKAYVLCKGTAISKIVWKEMDLGNSNAASCLEWAVTCINSALGTKLAKNEKRIEHSHKKVKRDSELEKPMGWRV